MTDCWNCSSSIGETEDRCATCGADVGFPNVRAARDESSELETRYSQVVKDSLTDGRRDSLVRFTESMVKTCAVINFDLRFLHYMLSNPKTLYGTYQLAVRAGVRKAAEGANDRHRMAIEGMFFGSYGDKISYAALSLDGRGLKSYGDYSIKLRDIVVKGRASLLEENTYTFAETHGIRSGSPIPPGYRSTWQERHKLAVAKLGSLVSNATVEAEYAQLLLTDGSSRRSDKFIEIHIYGPLDGNAIESVSGKSKLKKNPERGLAAQARQYLSRAGKMWVEE